MAKKQKKNRKRPQAAGNKPQQRTSASQADLMAMTVTSQRAMYERYARENPKAMASALSDPQLYVRLLKQYNLALVEAGHARSKTDLERLDVIDMRSLGRDAASPVDVPSPRSMVDYESYMAYVASTLPLYQILPCFEAGVVRVNTDRYFEFRLEAVDIDNGLVRAYMHDYTYRAEQDLWEPGVFGTVNIKTGAVGQDIEIYAADGDLFSFNRIYRMLDTKKLGWDGRARTLWKQTAVSQADRVQSEHKAAGQHQVIALGRLFVTFIGISNYYLNTRKPVLAKPRTEPKNKDSKSPERLTCETAGKATPERLVRTVGPIRIISAKRPRPAGSRTIRLYKVAEWTTRGHVRTYKSGKQVYIRPTKHRRRLLAEQDPGPAARPQAVLRFDPALRPETTKESEDA